MVCSKPPCEGKGISICVDEEWGECKGYQIPKEEQCNGFDDDCDNRIDEHYIGENELCGSFEGTCTKGTWKCTAGVKTCQGATNAVAEICDGLDNDCDGSTDETMQSSLCWTGPPDAVFIGPNNEVTANGICWPGSWRCTPSGPECFGQVLPQYDGNECIEKIDLDCSGGINTEILTPVDVIIGIDRSGSMGTVETGIIDGVKDFIRSTLELDVRIAIVRVDGNIEGENILSWDLSPAEELESEISAAIGLRSGSGREATLDFLVGVSTPSSSIYPSWRIGTRHVAVLITDEPCSSKWCSLIGCPDGHWCRNIVDEIHRLEPENVLELTKDVELISITTFRTWYAPATTAYDMPPTQGGMSKLLSSLLIELTCSE